MARFRVAFSLEKIWRDDQSIDMAKVSKKTALGRKFVNKARGAKVLVTTKDGVRILKPKGKATHFTEKELDDAIAAARSAKRAS